VVDGYKIPTTLPTDEVGKKNYYSNARAMNAGLFLRVDETVNTMKGLGEKIEEAIVVQKVLRSLPSRLDAKVSAIEEMHELDKLTMERFHGIITAYEMRTRK
jgi:hypothetical protein